MYNSDEATKDFHERIVELHRQIEKATPTPFHRWLSSLAQMGTLTRLWTQNVDGLEENFENLSASRAHDREDFPRTIRLHGTLEEMVCHQNKTHCYSFDPSYFTDCKPRDCPSCEEEQHKPVDRRGRPPKRSSTCVVGKIRPNIVLYDECEEGYEVEPILEQDLSMAAPPDCILIVGTRLRTPGAKRLLSQICRKAKQLNGDCHIIYMNKERRPLGKLLDALIDYRVEGDCQTFAREALKWNGDDSMCKRSEGY